MFTLLQKERLPLFWAQKAGKILHFWIKIWLVEVIMANIRFSLHGINVKQCNFLLSDKRYVCLDMQCGVII